MAGERGRKETKEAAVRSSKQFLCFSCDSTARAPGAAPPGHSCPEEQVPLGPGPLCGRINRAPGLWGGSALALSTERSTAHAQ